MLRKITLAVGLLLVTMGHEGGCCGGTPDNGVFGPPTGATCPQGSTLTYESFGMQFMTSYCTRCHSSELTGTARQGAPAFHDFDTVEGVRAVADHVDQTAAFGPEAQNQSMPPSGSRPSAAEREMLAEWLACGAP
jgi:cytochrome c5